MKGQADVIFLLGQGLAVSIAILVLAFSWFQIYHNPAYSTMIVNATATGKAGSASANTAIFLISNFFAFLWILSAVASVIATFFIDSAPVFAILGLVALPIEIILSMVFHDFFFTMATNSFLAPVVALIPTMVYFYTYLPSIALLFAVASIIFTYSKPRG
ncbi:MAG: hypothetical protein KGH64_00760 [Candidatus Micrarchaeota archaeon]|nr:hypothetical protein [Candidatus Micrarchaeota archaeon]